MSEERKEYKAQVVQFNDRAITYTVAGQEVRLTPQMVRQYLVTGNRDLVTDQEIVYFMNICRARSLNPFNKECYLIKYTQAESAAIIVSIEKLRMVARQSQDCVGWEKGIIVQKKDGELRYSKGLILDGEILLGGYFKAKPKGWETPFELEVNLKGYVKKTKDGNVTRFWNPDNQPTMIAKVAEAQGLRTVWPEKVQGLYIQEEVGSAEAIDVDFHHSEETKEIPVWCDEIQPTIDADPEKFERFVAATIQANRTTEADLRTAANADPEKFLTAYLAWAQKQAAEKRERKPRSDKGQPRKPQPAPDDSPMAGPPPSMDVPEPAPGPQADPPAPERQPGEDEPPPLSDELLLDERRAELDELKRTHRYYVLEAMKRTGIAHPMTVDAYDELIRQVWLIVQEKK